MTGFGSRAEVTNHREVMEVNFGNAIVRPMPRTLHNLPWAAHDKYRIGEVFCETFWIPPYRDGAPQTACTRYMARTQLDRLSALGYQLMSGYEAEFFMFRKDGDGDMASRPVFSCTGFYSSVIMSEHEELMCWMAKCLSGAGVDIESMHAEYEPGQLELATAPKFGIRSADDVFVLKNAVKEMCALRDLHATFMTKPATSEDSNQLHFNHSLWIGERNAFHDPVKVHGSLSTVGRHWIAGLLKHGVALSALCRPTVNCYRGFGEWLSPGKTDCGHENRNTMLRVVTTSPRTTYIENRLPSGAANPYVILAATVAAGIDGLVNRLEPPSDAEDHGEPLPSSLSEALLALEEDKVLCDALGEEFIRWFSSVKREVEIAKVNKAKEEEGDEMEVERELYFTYL